MKGPKQFIHHIIKNLKLLLFSSSGNFSKYIWDLFTDNSPFNSSKNTLNKEEGIES